MSDSDEIQTLRARLVEVERERDEAVRNCQIMGASGAMDVLTNTTERAAAAESRAIPAEGAARSLREALERIAACCEAREASGADPMQAESCDYDEHKIARAALSGLPPLTTGLPHTPAALVPKEDGAGPGEGGNGQ